MAVDSSAKRFSAINYGMPWRGVSVLPDSAVGQSDRQVLAFLYSGILAGGGITGPGRLEFTLPKCIPEFTVQLGLMEFTLPRSVEEYEIGSP